MATTIEGDSGADHLDGGTGIDTLDYHRSDSVSVNLATGLVSGGESQGDTITGFENVIGGNLDDILIGSSGANKLFGGSDDDNLVGGLGRDELTGGSGADRFDYASTTESGRTAATRDVIHDYHMNIAWEERVRTRAYEIWEREGWPDGGAEQHWLRAEEELRAEEAGLGKKTDDATKSVREQEIETENDRARKPTGTARSPSAPLSTPTWPARAVKCGRS